MVSAGRSPHSTVALVLAGCQLALFLLDESSGHRAVSLGVAAATAAVVRAPIGASGRAAALAAASMAAAVNVVAHMDAHAGSRLQVLRYATVLAYGGLTLTCLHAILGRAVAALTVTAGSIALVAWTGEGALEQRRSSRIDGAASVRWEGGLAPHPVLGRFYTPRSFARTIHGANPDGYFHVRDARAQRWSLSILHEQSAASLRFPDPKGDAVRVAIERAGTRAAGHIQLAYRGVNLVAGERYVLAFRARSDGPRMIRFGVAQASPPWRDLGLYRDVETIGVWRDHVLEFRAASTEPDARVIFDLGDDEPSVDLDAVAVRSVRLGGTSAVRTLADEPFVTYRFNDHGCRGADSASNTGRKRILVLGNGAALGEGVHEGDTLAWQLQNIVNPKMVSFGVEFDVVNCAANGFDTAEERRLFEALAPQYRPAVVLVAMTDDSVMETRLPVAGLLRNLRDELRERRSDFSENVRELRRLQHMCASYNARLAVAIFRTRPLDTGRWDALVRAVSTGLAGSGVPWIDLGDRLAAETRWRTLVIHPNGNFRPNHVAHRAAAYQISDWLHAQRMLD